MSWYSMNHALFPLASLCTIPIQFIIPYIKNNNRHHIPQIIEIKSNCSSFIPKIHYSSIQYTQQHIVFTSRMLAQTVATIALAADWFSPAIIVKFVIIGFELKVSSASAVLYWATSSWWGGGCGWYPPPRPESLLSESLSFTEDTLADTTEATTPDPCCRWGNCRALSSSINRGFLGPSSLDLSNDLRVLSIFIRIRDKTHLKP